MLTDTRYFTPFCVIVVAARYNNTETFVKCTMSTFTAESEAPAVAV